MQTDRMSAEPWLRGSLTDVPVVARALLHSLELTREDIGLWCGELTDAELNARPLGLPSFASGESRTSMSSGSSSSLGPSGEGKPGLAPVAFHIRHICRSIDRLLTYAEGHLLTDAQIASIETELDPGATHDSLFWEFRTTMERTPPRVRLLGSGSMNAPRIVGREALPTTVGGLLIHVAEHTQRHVGQAITTAKIVAAPRVSKA
jgi:hypothetical protein